MSLEDSHGWHGGVLGVKLPVGRPGVPEFKSWLWLLTPTLAGSGDGSMLGVLPLMAHTWIVFSASLVFGLAPPWLFWTLEE